VKLQATLVADLCGKILGNIYRKRRKLNMNKCFLCLIIIILTITSCVGMQPEVKREAPAVPELIMGQGLVGGEELALFLLQNNPQINPDYILMLAFLYINESTFEGVNHDIAFAQMCLETGYLTFGGLVKPEWNNFCGLGSIGPEQPGLIFPDPRTGVRAHVQHLKAYATADPLNGELVDPRYRFVRLGSSPTISGLAGAWAADRQYAVKINAILERMYVFAAGLP
jgi:hypothetical protein